MRGPRLDPDGPRGSSAVACPWALPPDRALAELGSSPDGIEEAEAEARLGRWGPNAIEEGTYPFVTHSFGDMVKGAVGVLATQKAPTADGGGAAH